MNYIVFECLIILLLTILYVILFIGIVNIPNNGSQNTLKSNYSTLNNSIEYQTVDITDLLEAEFPRIYYLILDE